MVGISTMDPPERVRDFAAKYGLTYLQLRDPGASLHGRFAETDVIPRTIVLDPRHRIALLELGYTEQKLRKVVRAVRSALGEPDAPTEAVAAPPTTASSAPPGPGWVVEGVETIDSRGSVGYFTSIDLDAAGHAWISYRDYTQGCLKVARESAAGWQVDVVDARGDAGWSSSIRIGPSGGAAVSYFAGEMGRGELRYARFSAEGWQVQTVDTGDVGSFTSLAFDASGRPRISYFDVGGKDLKLARGSADGGRWATETVDAEGDVGLYTSLALDSAGHPWISYFDEGAKDLKLARWSPKTRVWEIETVDAEGDVGMHTSLALDADGTPLIAYFDRSREDLKLARRSERGWAVETVDSEGTVGQRSSLELRPGRGPVISYFGNATLKLAWRAEDGWRHLTVDAGGVVGNYTSLALAADRAVISYFDVSKADLKVARLAGVVSGAGSAAGR